MNTHMCHVYIYTNIIYIYMYTYVCSGSPRLLASTIAHMRHDSHTTCRYAFNVRHTDSQLFVTLTTQVSHEVSCGVSPGLLALAILPSHTIYTYTCIHTYLSMSIIHLSMYLSISLYIYNTFIYVSLQIYTDRAGEC